MLRLRIDRLEHLMDGQNVSSKNLADAAGLSYTFIYLLRKGERADVSASNLAAIADALQTNTEYLLGRIDDPRPIDAMGDKDALAYLQATNPELAALYEVVLSLPPELQKEAIERLEADLAMFQRMAELQEQARNEEDVEEKT